MDVKEPRDQIDRDEQGKVTPKLRASGTRDRLGSSARVFTGQGGFREAPGLGAGVFVVTNAEVL